jgi:hypothetical protein
MNKMKKTYMITSKFFPNGGYRKDGDLDIGKTLTLCERILERVGMPGKAFGANVKF